MLTIVALAMRLYGISWGLPTETESLRSYHPDEAPFINSIAYVRNPFRFPHFNLVMGTWHLYCSGAAVAAGAATGWFTLTGDRTYYETHLVDLDRLYLSGRLLSAVLGAGCVPLAFLIGRLWYGSAAGLLAAALVTVVPLLVVDSHYFYTSIPVVFWSLLALWFIARLQTSATVRRRDLCGAGCCAALAVFVQYNAVLLVPLIPLALWLRPQRPVWQEWRHWMVWTAAALLIGSVLACPNAWFDPAGFLRHFGPYFAGHFGGAHKAETNYQGNAFLFYLWRAPREACGLTLYVALWPGLLAALARRRASDWLLLVFLGLNLLLLARNDTYMMHYLTLPLPSALLLLAALLARVRVHMSAMTTGLLIAVVLAAPLLESLAYDRLLARSDVRTRASQWLEARVPPGTTVGVNDIYFYSLPVLQRVGGSPYALTRYQFDVERLKRERSAYFVICDFEFGIGERMLRRDYRPAIGGWRIFEHVRASGDYSLAHEESTRVVLGGLDFTLSRPTWHWRYPQPRVWIYRCVRENPAVDQPMAE